MPTTPNKEFQRIRPLPDGLLPTTEVFYLSSTNEVFLDYDDYFERMIQLNSSCWRCTVTGRSGMTYDEALKCESDAIRRKKKREETMKSKKQQTTPLSSPTASTSKAAAVAQAADEARKKRQIHDQQQQLEPLFRQAEKAGVEQLDRWRQQRRLLNDSHIGALREAIQAAKEAERRRQLERQRREREALAEWRRPRDDLLCEDLKPFPDFKALRWPDWVPHEHCWDIVAIACFCRTFDTLLLDQQDDDGHERTPTPPPFTVPQIATALVSHQIAEHSCFYRLLDTLLNALRQCITEDDGAAADLSNPDHIGNEVQKDIDHPVHGKRIRRINRECIRHRKIHCANVWDLSRDFLNLSEALRLLLCTAGFYTKWRRQMRGLMHCYEDDAFLFVQQHPDIVELLEKVSVYALSPAQRVRLITTLMDQLLSHSRFRKLIDERIDALSELRKRLRQLKVVDQQHDKEARDALQHVPLQAKTAEDEAQHQQLVGADKDEQRARVAAQRELALLRRAITQLNEGRRVKDIGDLRERVLDAQHALPWRVMADAHEVHEFRTLQRNFHADKVQELLRDIYQLQGKMGMFLLGRDRAFRSYYYINSAFIIRCPRRDELSGGGHCWGERTPLKAKAMAADSSGTDTDGGREDDGRVQQRTTAAMSATKKSRQRRREESRSVSAATTADNDREAAEEERNRALTPKQQQNGTAAKIEDDREARNSAEQRSADAEDAAAATAENRRREVEEALHCSPPLDPLMACTGGGMADPCPVHNPPPGWPQLLFLLERDGVRKLLNALNPRGFREMELADSITMFREIYEQEMCAVLDATAAAAVPNLGAHLFGFGRSVPKELREQGPSTLGLLDLFDELHQRGLGTPHCSIGREEWRAALEMYGDTSMLCRGNCVPLIRPTSPAAAMPPSSTTNGAAVDDEQTAIAHHDNPNDDDEQQNGVENNNNNGSTDFLYTRQELSNTNATPLSRVQKLGIALMQLVHGIRRDCFTTTFMSNVKRNGIVKTVPTTAFVEWQRALKACQSPSAIALFETTLEFAINWDFKVEEEQAAATTTILGRQQRRQQQKSKNARQRQAGGAVAAASGANTNDGGINGEPSTSSADAVTATTAQPRRQYKPRQQGREVNNLLMEAGCMGGMAIGARKRKPVTKYGDVEMDVDKLNFDEEDEEEEGEEKRQEEDSDDDGDMVTQRPQQRQQRHDDDDDSGQDDDDEEDEYDEGMDDDDDAAASNDLEQYAYTPHYLREASTRQRKPVTKYGGAADSEMDELSIDNEEEEEEEEAEAKEEQREEEEKEKREEEEEEEKEEQVGREEEEKDNMQKEHQQAAEVNTDGDGQCFLDVE